MIYVDKKSCRGCAACINNAPKGAIKMNNGFAEIVNKNCKNEKDCINACPFGAIKKK